MRQKRRNLTKQTHHCHKYHVFGGVKGTNWPANRLEFIAEKEVEEEEEDHYHDETRIQFFLDKY